MSENKLTPEERLDIQELFAKYCWALNTGDLEGYLRLFTEDGWVDHKPQGRCQGRAEISRLLNQVWYSMPHNYLGRQHYPYNFLITREGDAARAKVYWSINRLEQGSNTFHLFLQGHWDGLCVQHRGEWKFKELSVVHWYRETAPWVGDPEARLERRGKWG